MSVVDVEIRLPDNVAEFLEMCGPDAADWTLEAYNPPRRTLILRRSRPEHSAGVVPVVWEGGRPGGVGVFHGTATFLRPEPGPVSGGRLRNPQGDVVLDFAWDDGVTVWLGREDRLIVRVRLILVP